MRASPEELTRAGLKPDEITNLRSAAESLGFRQTFSAETALSVSSFPGISTEQTQSAQSTLRATIPGDQLGKTTITREGTTLSYSDPENPSYAYRIDMATRPPRLTKSRNGLSISYEKQPDNPELEKIQGEVKSAESTFGKVRTEVSDSLQGAGLYSMNLDKYPIAEVQKLFTGTDFQSLQEEI